MQGHVNPSLLPLKVDFTFLPGSVSLSSAFCQFSPPAIIKSNQHQALQPASNQPSSIAKRQSFVSRAELLFFQGHSTFFFFLSNISLFAFLHLIFKQNSTVKHPQKKKTPCPPTPLRPSPPLLLILLRLLPMLSMMLLLPLRPKLAKQTPLMLLLLLKAGDFTLGILPTLLPRSS